MKVRREGSDVVHAVNGNVVEVHFFEDHHTWVAVTDTGEMWRSSDGIEWDKGVA